MLRFLELFRGKPEIPVRVLEFKELWNKSIVNVWKLLEILRFQFIYYRVITGRGLEFDRLREYTPEDDAKFIDWRAFARCRKPYVKVFKEERRLDIVFLVDVSTTMVLGTTRYTKNEYASILATTLALVSQSLGDRVCLVAFSDEIKKFVEPGISIDNVLQIAKALCDREIYGGGKNWRIVSPTILETFGPNTFVFILSDFIGEKRDLYDLLMKFSNKFKGVAGIMIRDPLDSYIPEGIGKIYIQDPMTGEVMLVDMDKIREEYNRTVEEEERKLKEVFLSYGSLFAKTLTNNFDFPGLILSLFGGRLWK